jgi:hypothetical protein
MTRWDMPIFFSVIMRKQSKYQKNALHQDPSVFGALVTLACTYAQLGREEKAKHYVDELLRLIPRFTLHALRRNPMFVRPEYIDKLVESMSLAGLPE